MRTLKDSFVSSVEYVTYRQEKDREFLSSLSSFFDKHCFCVHRSDFILSICLARSARYICLGANSICFRFAQTRYDINPRSRSEHIECVSTYRTRKRISKIRESGFISMRSVLKGTTLTVGVFYFTPANRFSQAPSRPKA